jgi:hypothetical protein
MAIWSSSRTALEEALIELGFLAAHQFGVFVTYERELDLVKVHVAPDGMFAAFDLDDEILGEGTGAEDLRSVLINAALTAARDTGHRRSFLDRRTRTKGSSSRPHAQVRSVKARAEHAPVALSATAFNS